MGRLVAARPKTPWGGQCRHSRHLMWLCPGTTGAGAGRLGAQMHSARQQRDPSSRHAQSREGSGHTAERSPWKFKK